MKLSHMETITDCMFHYYEVHITFLKHLLILALLYLSLYFQMWFSVGFCALILVLSSEYVSPQKGIVIYITGETTFVECQEKNSE